MNELEFLAVVWGLEHFRLYVYGKPIELLTNHQALEPLIKRYRSNKTYSARLTRWLDRLANFDINIKHVAGKHLCLTDYLSRNPISKPEPIQNCYEEYVINCIIPLLEFINNHGSIADEKESLKRASEWTDANSTNNQSEIRKVNKPQINEIEQNERTSSLPLQITTAQQLNRNSKASKTIMDLRTVESIEREDPTEESLKLTSRWKEIVKPGDYRYPKDSGENTFIQNTTSRTKYK